MNEDELSRELEHHCGGHEKAFRLMRIWEDTANPVSFFPLTYEEKQSKRLENFKNRAKNEDYSENAINTYLRIQGY